MTPCSFVAIKSIESITVYLFTRVLIYFPILNEKHDPGVHDFLTSRSFVTLKSVESAEASVGRFSSK